MAAVGVPPSHASVATATPAAPVPRAPIDIEGNANFTAANGVVSGQGTAADPYVIAGWSIAAPPGIGVQFRNTAAHVIVRDVDVSGAPVAGYYLYSVSNVTLSNVTAYASGGEAIRIESSRSVVVSASTLLGNQAGAVVLNSADVTIRGSNVTLNTSDGVAVSGSPSVVIEDNNVSLNGFGNSGYGIHLTSTTDDTVSGNRFFLNGVYLDGTAPGDFDSHTITPDNLVSGLPILYERNCAGVSLSGMALGGLLVANCRHARFSNMTLAGGDVGIELAFATDVLVGPNVTISGAATGLRALRSGPLRILDGDVLNCAQGILLESSTDVNVSGSKITAPSLFTQPLDGIAIHASNLVNLTGNVIRRARNAVETESSGNVSLLDNLLGLSLAGLNAYRSQDLLVLNNQFVDDGSGIRFLNVTNASVERNQVLSSFTDGANVSGSARVDFVRNTFSGNPNNAVDYMPASDAWDGGYPAGGNYWWNYRGVDAYSGPNQNIAGPDGIGDTPYLFNVNAVDRYPLMAPPVTRDVPPEGLFAVSPIGGNPLTLFSVSANLSSDYEDPPGSLQVRWSWDVGASWGPWTTTKYASHMYSTPGDHTIRFEVRDTVGLTDNWTATVTVTPKPDNTPPVIVSAPPASVDVGLPLRIVANVSDASGLANVTLLYRGVSDSSFTAVLMGVLNGTNFTATIPAQPHAGTVQYVIVANDSWGNEARAPLSGFTTVPVVDPVMNALVFWVLPGVLATTAVAVAAYLVLRRRRRAAPPDDSGPPPGNP